MLERKLSASALAQLAGILLECANADAAADASADASADDATAFPSEEDVATLKRAAQTSHQFAEVEYIFIEHHRVRLWEAGAPRLSAASTADLVAVIYELWHTHAMPERLAALDVLSGTAVSSIRTIFASLVRVCAGDLLPLVEHIAASIPPLAERGSSSSTGGGTGGGSSNNAELRFLHEMYLFGLDEEANLCLAKIIPLQIDSYVVATWALRYETGAADAVRAWVHAVLLPEVCATLNSSMTATKTGAGAGAGAGAEIERLALRALGQLRISELTHIVEKQLMYGIEDLRQAIAANRELRQEVVVRYTQHCNRLLLNGASDTVDIIFLYLRTIHAFSRLDPQGVLLERVSSRIRQTLQERSDTCARLAEGLFGLPSSPLAFLATGIKQTPSTVTRHTLIESFRSWEPDPIDTPADYVRKLTKDSVSTLINLFDNKGVFVQQLAVLYAVELLNMPIEEHHDDLLRLKNHFELMCRRFNNAAAMQGIRVMIADYVRSCALAAEIHVEAPHLHNIAPLVLSRLYWPASVRGKQKKSTGGHGSGGGHSSSSHTSSSLGAAGRRKLKTMVDEYTRLYKRRPGHEKLDLEWLPDRGRVTICIHLQDRELELVVQPDQAALIQVFDEDQHEGGAASVSFAELRAATEFDEQHLLAVLQFWMDHGVIGTDGEKYRVLETREDVEAQASTHVVVAGAGTGTNSSGTASRRGGGGGGGADPFEDMHGYFSYIVGMLTNLGALTVDRIHSFLVMFVPSEDPYVKSKQELESYLLAMVDEGKLALDDQKYSLVKK